MHPHPHPHPHTPHASRRVSHHPAPVPGSRFHPCPAVLLPAINRGNQGQRGEEGDGGIGVDVDRMHGHAVEHDERPGASVSGEVKRCVYFSSHCTSTSLHVFFSFVFLPWCFLRLFSCFKFFRLSSTPEIAVLFNIRSGFLWTILSHTSPRFSFVFAYSQACWLSFSVHFVLIFPFVPSPPRVPDPTLFKFSFKISVGSSSPFVYDAITKGYPVGGHPCIGASSQASNADEHEGTLRTRHRLNRSNFISSNFFCLALLMSVMSCVWFCSADDGVCHG